MWAYIRWGDMYYLDRKSEKVPFDYQKAKDIYEMALAVGLDGSPELAERLELLPADSLNRLS